MKARVIEEQHTKPDARLGSKQKANIMITYSTRKKVFNFLVLITCLIISASFVIGIKNFEVSLVKVSVQQKNTTVNVLVKAPKNTSVQFYMFGTDGNLVRQIQMTGTQQFSIENLPKGYYLYELFNNDERLKRGDIQIK